MFAGIIEQVGQIAFATPSGVGSRLRVRTPLFRPALRPGESISVDGVCLTVARTGRGWFEADCSPETLKVTTLGSRSASNPVNLERALRPSDRIGGHFVQGHVDGIGRTVRIRKAGESCVIRFEAPPGVRSLLVLKGSVAVDGVSLTVSGLEADGFEVSLIPFTLAATTLGRLRVGGRVNLEADILGKYVRSFVEGAVPSRHGAARRPGRRAAS